MPYQHHGQYFCRDTRVLKYFWWFSAYLIRCIQCTQPPLYYLGEYGYRDVKLFLESEERCKFNPYEETNYFSAKTNAEEIPCKILLNNLWPGDEWYEVASHQVQYYGYSGKHTFMFTAVNCLTKGYRTIEMLILCEDKKVVNRGSCTNTSECNERELCRNQQSLQQKLCIPMRQLYNSCDIVSCYNGECRDDSGEQISQCKQFYNPACGSKKKLYEECMVDDQCSGTPNATVCKEINHRKLCWCTTGYVADHHSLKCQKEKINLSETCETNLQCSSMDYASVCGKNNKCRCKKGYIDINRNCLPGNLSLGQTCLDDVQCKGTENGGNCLKGVCFCEKGFVIQNLRCLQDKRHFGDSCEAHIQCSGTENANVCGENKTCICNKHFVRIEGDCFTGNLSLGQSCTHNLQCTGTTHGERCLNGKCFCEEGYVLQRLNCLLDKRHFGDSCEAHIQCSGTENVNVCGENKTCICNEHFVRIEGDCFPGNMSLGQSCTHNLQCTGTTHGERCLDGECFCEEGFVLQRLRCLPGNSSLGQSCTHNVQCTGTEHGEKCLNGECACEEGFVPQKDMCIHVPNETNGNCIGKDNWLFASTGVGVFGTIMIYSTVLFVLKRRKSGKKRLTDCNSPKKSIRNIHYSVAEGIDLQCVHEPAQDFSADYNSIDNIYSELHQREKEQEFENVYDASQPHSSYRREGSETNLYTYNHLHEKPIGMAESIYDDPNAIPLSSFCTKPVEKF
uniref:Tenascin-like isoform X1 n=1 Tax=Crassostrea virginica TaxID=6565 RepID=A0A8B8B034_CRAVI|nr:tenascin-like isoform X1 [Crassostrea virginica]